ncbi:MAG: hypothetical protein HKN14_01475 [Marinicaulis sp.]|nr:hypothetical protein [Marinicaulis sp.]NNE39567.1 hypothetical protein [Marinicaulis sp.]NNL88924.1 hypothetical protein [Marinicaulis sp.]
MFHVIFSYRRLQREAFLPAESTIGGYFGWSDRYGMREGGEFAGNSGRAADKPVFLANW